MKNAQDHIPITVVTAKLHWVANDAVTKALQAALQRKPTMVAVDGQSYYWAQRATTISFHSKQSLAARRHNTLGRVMAVGSYLGIDGNFYIV